MSSTAPEHPPVYYRLPSGLDQCRDLTDLFVLRYGARAVLFHLLMDQEQYSWRCLSHGELDADQQKIQANAQRIQALLTAYPWLAEPDIQQPIARVKAELVALALREEGWLCIRQADGFTTQTLDEMATILRTNGYWVAETVEELRESVAQKGLVLWEYRDNAPMLTAEELDVETERHEKKLVAQGLAALVGMNIGMTLEYYYPICHQGHDMPEALLLRVERMLVDKKYDLSSKYEDFKTQLARDPELSPYFPFAVIQ
jgi:hypothetical protein